MQNNKLDRARQFLPFDALKGFREMLLEKEREIEERRELSLDNIEAIDLTFKDINIGTKIKIIYYDEYHYIEIIDIVKRIDNIDKKIYLNNKIIDFKDIIRIEIVK